MSKYERQLRNVFKERTDAAGRFRDMNPAKISGVEVILEIEGIGIVHILEKCHRLNIQVCEADPKLRPTMEEFMSRSMVEVGHFGPCVVARASSSTAFRRRSDCY